MSESKAVQIASGLATTAEAAQAIRTQPQTLRVWASTQSGPIIPVRIGRRLFWHWVDIEALVNGERDSQEAA